MISCYHMIHSSNFTLNRSLDAATDSTDPKFNNLLRLLATTAMSEAKYFSTGSKSAEDRGHYGLGLAHYTHFTSPIRRYADMCVHRQLMASLYITPNDGEKSPPGSEAAFTALFNATELKGVADHLNIKNRAAKMAQRDSYEYFLREYILTAPLEKCEVDAMITSLRSDGFIVYIPSLSCSGAVYLLDAGGVLNMPPRLWTPDSGPNRYVLMSGGSLQRHASEIEVHTVTGEKHSFRMFNHVRVLVTVERNRYHRHTLKLQLVHILAPVPDSQKPLCKVGVIKEVLNLHQDRPVQEKKGMYLVMVPFNLLYNNIYLYIYVCEYQYVIIPFIHVLYIYIYIYIYI